MGGLSTLLVNCFYEYVVWKEYVMEESRTSGALRRGAGGLGGWGGGLISGLFWCGFRGYLGAGELLCVV